METEDYEWLGSIYPDDIKPGVTLITPIAFYSEDGLCPISQNEAISYFPNNGKVALFAKDFPPSKIGWLHSFWVKHNPNVYNLENSRHSHYMVHYEPELSSLAQLFDWTSLAKHSYDLPALLDQGIPKENCYCQQIYVRHQNYLYGPIRLELDIHTKRLKPREYLRSSDTGGQPLLISKYATPEQATIQLGDPPHQFFVFNEDTLKTPVQQEDWSQPQVVIKRVLKASNEILPNLQKEIRLVDKRVNELARLSSQNGPSALHIEQATIKHAQYIVKHQMEHLQDLRALIEELPAEHSLMKTARELEIGQRKVEIEQEVQVRIQEQTTRIAQLQHDRQDIEARVQAEQANLQALQHDIQTTNDKKAQAQRELDTFEREVRQRLTRLREEPLQVFAELQTTLSLFPALRQNGLHNDTLQTQESYAATSPVITHHQQVQQRPSTKNAISWIPDTSTQAIDADFKKIPKNFWVPVAQQFNIKSKSMPICLASLVAGFVPLFSGEVALSLARAVAQAITGGRIWSVPIPLTALTPLDLFGTINLEKQIFIPSTGSLADIVLQAHIHPQELALVIFEGIDRAPAMSVSVPLLRQYRETRQASIHTLAPLPLNLFHAGALADDDPYLKLAWFTWPSNLLLAVTYDDDISSMPIPTLCESWFAHIEATPRSIISSMSTSNANHVSFDLWQKWEKEIQLGDSNNTSYEEELNTQQKLCSKAFKLLNIPKSEADHAIEQAWPQQFGINSDTRVKETH